MDCDIADYNRTESDKYAVYDGWPNAFIRENRNAVFLRLIRS
jgi:hypothetical protein